MNEELIINDVCVICLDKCYKNDFLTFPILKSTCECKYNMHVECFRKYKLKCPMCQSIINIAPIVPIEPINHRYNIGKCFGCILTILFLIGIFGIIMYFIIFRDMYL